MDARMYFNVGYACKLHDASKPYSPDGYVVPLNDLYEATRDELALLHAKTDSADERISVLFTAVSTLRNQIAELEAKVTGPQDEVITDILDRADSFHYRILALEAKDKGVDTSQEPVHVVDTSVLVEALRDYADRDNWEFQARCGGAHFKSDPTQPWEFARRLLREAGIE